MKKLYRTLTVITLLSIILSSFLFFPDISFAENNPPQFFSNAPKEIPVLNARHAVVLDNTTGRILFEKDAYTKTAMASTTKLMTALIVAENIDISAIVKVSAKAASTGGSTIDLHQGEEITVLDLLYGLMLRSGNDAAVALSEAVAGSVESFCTLMNCKAKALGAYNTHFTSPHGLDSHEHYTTAYDLALICRAASQNSIVNKIMGTKHYETPRRFLINTNPFLGVTPEVTGGKTGFTNNAGRCIALTASKNNLDITIILIGCSDSKGRVSDGNKIINYIYSSYTMYNIVSGNTAIATLGNSKSRTGNAEIITENDIKLPLTAFEHSNLNVRLNVFEGTYTLKGNVIPLINTNNEIGAGECVGSLIIELQDGTVLQTSSCFVTSSIIEKDFWYYLKKVIVCWFGTMV